MKHDILERRFKYYNMTEILNQCIGVEIARDHRYHISLHSLDSYFAIAEYTTINERQKKKELIKESIYLRYMGFHETHLFRLALKLHRYGPDE
jgi:hypothetical protein